VALFISHEVIRKVLTMADAFDAVERAFLEHAAGDAETLPRQRMRVPGGVYRSMSGVLPSAGVFGTKCGLQSFEFVEGVMKASAQVLCSSETGDLLALFWSDLITDFRTGAMGGVSAKYLARPDAATIGVLGSGTQARTQLLAVALARPPERVLVFSPRPERREAFALRISQELGIEARAVEGAEAAVRAADILITATNSSVPVLDGSWLKAGSHVISIRSSYSYDIGTGGERRELDDRTVERSNLITVDFLEQAILQESPELKARIDEGEVFELGASMSGLAPGRENEEDITLFKSFGTGLMDVAVAAVVYAKAWDGGLGVELDSPRAS
jgi:ornithine cyclodeaminase